MEKRVGSPTPADGYMGYRLAGSLGSLFGTVVAVIPVVLGALFNPEFYLLSGLIGAGLIFAGVSGFCGMARLLTLMPWNKRTADVQ